MDSRRPSRVLDARTTPTELEQLSLTRMAQDQGARLQRIATRAMIQYGLEPEWPPQAEAELAHLPPSDGNGLRDLRNLPWSSIDNDDSRDLDQLEVCVPGDGAPRCSSRSPTSIR